jgi:hypothetical protein
MGGAREFNLDDEATRRAATSDPAGFIAALTGPPVIDEIQRAPDLMLAMKERMDADHTTRCPAGADQGRARDPTARGRPRLPLRERADLDRAAQREGRDA